MRNYLNLAWKYKVPIFLWIIFAWVIFLLLFWAISPNTSPLWTGFGEYKKATGDIDRAKTLWDWMNLLIVPLLVAIGLWYLNKTEKSSEQKIATERINEQSLQSYLDYMTNLMLKGNLLNSPDKDSVGSIARARTITTLRSLDSVRKGLVINFLYESNLISQNPIVSLKGADISKANLNRLNLVNLNFKFSDLSYSSFQRTRLSGANFHYSKMSFADLSKADLITAEFYLANLYSSDISNATLVSANFTSAKMEKATLENSLLTNATFHGANLSAANLQNTHSENANFTRCNLSKANLRNANLSGAILQAANLENADLRGAKLDNADLSLANLTGAKLNNLTLEMRI